MDVRLNNISQLAGFSKRDDLRYFLGAITGIEYLHLPELAPTKEMLDAYRMSSHDWDGYAARFLALIDQRQVENTVAREMFGDSCLLCSEAEADHCHRRLVAEYLRERWGNVEITHL
jgi:uncharacterized protein (DUF488 family)